MASMISHGGGTSTDSGLERASKLIETEIDENIAAATRSGATRWALLVAIAALATIAAEYSGGVVGARALLLLAASGALYDLLTLGLARSGFSWSAGRLRLPDKKTRFRSLSESLVCLPACRVFFAVRTASLLAILIGLWIITRVPLRVVLFGITYYSFMLFGLVGREILFRHYNVTIPVEGHSAHCEHCKNVTPLVRTSRLIRRLWTATLVIFVPLAVRESLRSPGWLHDARLAVLLLAMIEVARALIHALRPNPVVESLQRLRRLIGLNKITHAEARTELEIIILGADTGAMLQASLGPLLETLGEVRARIRAMTSNLEEVLSLIARRKSGRQSGKERNAIASSLREFLDRAQAHKHFVESKIPPSYRAFRAAIAAAKHGGDLDVVQQVNLRVDAEFDAIKRQNAELTQRGAELKRIAARIKNRRASRASKKKLLTR